MYSELQSRLCSRFPYFSIADETVEFASAANALKHSIHGDALIASAAEVSRLADSGDGTVRMIR